MYNTIKTPLACCAVLLFGVLTPAQSAAQSKETVQLLLNVEKLAQFKQILSDMKKGYDILDEGYRVISDLSQGNFNLHKAFLDGLMQVSPIIKRDQRVVDMVNVQLLIVKEYKSAFKRFKQSDHFQPEELNYIARVYDRLLKQSLLHIDELLLILTANQLRMSDDERLKALDELHKNLQDELIFVRAFNNNTQVLMFQRMKEMQETRFMKNLLLPKTSE